MKQTIRQAREYLARLSCRTSTYASLTNAAGDFQYIDTSPSQAFLLHTVLPADAGISRRLVRDCEVLVLKDSSEEPALRIVRPMNRGVPGGVMLAGVPLSPDAGAAGDARLEGVVLGCDRLHDGKHFSEADVAILQDTARCLGEAFDALRAGVPGVRRPAPRAQRLCPMNSWLNRND